MWEGGPITVDGVDDLARLRHHQPHRRISYGESQLMNINAQDRELRYMLGQLKQEHRDLDSAVDALADSGRADQLQVMRLKKKKLNLKDEIARIEDQLLPDIIA